MFPLASGTDTVETLSVVFAVSFRKTQRMTNIRIRLVMKLPIGSGGVQYVLKDTTHT